MKTGYGIQAKLLGILLTVCVVALFGACQGGSSISTPRVATPTTGEETSYDQMLADLEGLSAPPDSDLQLFEELKLALSAALANLGQQRFVSLAPYTELSAVTDFSIQANLDDTATLSWTYRSQGDYDQNSEVNVADLTPIVINYGANSTEVNWANASVADGDDNGEVNQSDITPIATNYARTVTGYSISTSPTPFVAESWVPVEGDVPFSVGVIPDGLSRRAFEYTLAGPVSGNYYMVTPYHEGDEGPVSNFNKYSAPAIPGAPLGLTATQGTLVGSVELSWSPLEGAANYMVERRIGQVGDFVELGLALPTLTSFTNMAVVAGEVYQYRVQGVNGERVSAYSNSAVGWPMRITDAPQNLDASDGTSAVSVELSWDGNAEAAEYVIYRSTVSGSGHLEIDRTSELTFSDTTATTEFIYYYKVTSTNAVGESGASNENDGWLDGYVYPPVIDSVDPTSGSEGSDTTFSVVTSGGAVDTYSWDFGGGATPDTSTDASPTVTMGAAGTYNASLIVANINGEDTFDFELTVGSNQWVHTWGTEINELGHGAGVDGQGNVYTIGRDSASTNMFATKFSNIGELEWAVGFDSGVYPYFFDSTVDSLGNVYVASCDGIYGETGVAISKISPDGDMVWQKTWTDNPVYRSFIRVDNSDDVFLCVDSEDAGGLGFHVVEFKLNPDGTTQWMRYIKHNGDREGPESHDGSLSGFSVDDFGDSYIIHFEARVLKIDSSGNALWQKGWETGYHDHPYGAATLPGGDLLLGGGGGDGYHPFLIRLDSAGDLVFDIGFELTSVGDPGAGGLDHLNIVGDRIWALIASDHPGGWADKYSQLVEFSFDGDILGHWGYTTAGSGSSLWSFGIAGNGVFIFTGYDDNNMGIWEVATHNDLTMDGTVSDLPYEVTNGTAVFVPNDLAITSPVAGTLDTGGGGTDMLAIKLDPASLP